MRINRNHLALAACILLFMLGFVLDLPRPSLATTTTAPGGQDWLKMDEGQRTWTLKNMIEAVRDGWVEGYVAGNKHQAAPKTSDIPTWSRPIAEYSKAVTEWYEQVPSPQSPVNVVLCLADQNSKSSFAIPCPAKLRAELKP